MTDAELNRAPKTDADLNAAVARARGWTKCDCGDEACPYWRDENGSDWFNDICTDPAAWGALLIEITKAPYFYRIALIYEVEWLAYIYPPHGAQNENEVIGYASNAEPGRALALAFLKAQTHKEQP